VQLHNRDALGLGAAAFFGERCRGLEREVKAVVHRLVPARTHFVFVVGIHNDFVIDDVLDFFGSEHGEKYIFIVKVD